jgi:hypothetical protein
MAVAAAQSDECWSQLQGCLDRLSVHLESIATTKQLTVAQIAATPKLLEQLSVGEPVRLKTARCDADAAPPAPLLPCPFAAAAGPGDITAADLNNPRFASSGHGYDDTDPKGIVKRATDDHFYGSDDLFDEEPVFDEGPVFDEEPSIEIDSGSFNNSAPFNYSTYCLSDVMTSATFDEGPVFDEEPTVL